VGAITSSFCPIVRFVHSNPSGGVLDESVGVEGVLQTHEHFGTRLLQSIPYHAISTMAG
jgi:hypothetical protein